jgi:hypothetical protein
MAQGQYLQRLTIYFVSKEFIELKGEQATEFMKQYSSHHNPLFITVKTGADFLGQQFEEQMLIERRNIERVFVTTFF